MSVSEAKARLLLYGEVQSLKVQIATAKIKNDVRRATPWAAGGAGLLGLLLGWSRKTRGRQPEPGRAKKVAGVASGVMGGSVTGTVARWALRTALPVALNVASRLRARRAAARAERAARAAEAERAKSLSQ